ncbi:MAG: hypothetical protein IPH75_14425 [bacterium]|nr:hypothetical protein [bacterium]
MNYLHIWADLKESHKDLEFCDAVDAYLGNLQKRGQIESFTLTRRKFGFGPETLGEFHIVVATRDLAQLDAAFGTVASRTGEIERLHIPVYAACSRTQAALYRDFPDPERSR